MASIISIQPNRPMAFPQSSPQSDNQIKVALWPIVIVLYATLLPREIRLSIGSFDLFADRLGLVLAIPYIIRKLMDGAIRFVLPDLMILFMGVWMIASMIAHYGLATGLERGGSVAMDATVGYFLSRISFRTLNDIRKVLILFAPGVFLAGSLTMLESILHRPIVQPVAESLFGKLPFFMGGDVAGYKDRTQLFRLGLMRAKGPFSHSILAGVYLSSLIGIYSLSGLRGIPKFLGMAAGIFGFFALSSAATLAIAMSFALIAFEFIRRYVRELSWTMLIGVGVVFAIIVQIGTGSGVDGLVGRYLTYNSSTAHFRQLIWEYGTQSVYNNPWIGIGFSAYERPDWMLTESVDAHWLLLAIRFGLPPAVALAIAVIAALVALANASTKVPLQDQQFYRGIAISLFVIVVSMLTVTLWGGTQSWFNHLLGGCVACAQNSYRAVRVTRIPAKKQLIRIRPLP